MFVGECLTTKADLDVCPECTAKKLKQIAENCTQRVNRRYKKD